jgi:Mg2+-importing ATPase
VIYLILVELAKRLFFTERAVSAHRRRRAGHQVHRRASRFTHAGRLS